MDHPDVSTLPTNEIHVHETELQMQKKELRRIEQELGESLNRYEDLYDFAPVGYLTVNRMCIILEANLTAARLLGMVRDDLIGKSLYSLVPKEYQDYFYFHLMAVYQSQTTKTCELRLRKNDGTEFNAELRSIAEKGADGAYSRFRTIIADITERKQSEVFQLRLRTNLESLWKLSKIKNVNLKFVADYVLEEIKTISASTYAFYGFINDDETEMEIYSWSEEAMNQCRIDDKPRIFSIAKAGIWADAIRKRQSIINNDYGQDHEGKLGLPEGHVRLTRFVSIPVFSKGKIVAVGAVANKESEYTQDDVKHLEAFLSHAQIIADQKRGEDVLRESDLKFRTVADFTYDWEYWISPDGHLIYMSPSCERITGYRSDEFINNPCLIQEIVHPEDLSIVGNHFASIDSGPPHQIEFRIVSRKGETRWIGHSCQSVFSDDGQWLGRRVSNRDITVRKLAEESLKQSEQKFRSIFENSPVGIFHSTLSGELIEANAALARILKYDSPEDLISKVNETSIADALYVKEEKRSAIVQEVQSKIGQWTVTENQYRCKDGSIITAVLHFRAINSTSDNPCQLEGFVEDINEIKQSEAKYRHIVETVNEGFWSMDGLHVTTLVNEKMADMLGYGIEEVIGKKVEDFMFADDIQDHETKMARRHQGQIESYERRFRRKDGTTLWTLASATPIVDQSGAFNGSFAMFTDITDRKRAEQELRNFKTIADQATYGYAISDIHGFLTYVNDTFANMHGFSSQELIGKNLSVVNNDEQREHVSGLLEKLNRDGIFELQEVWHAKKDGTVFPTLMSAAVIKDDKGVPQFLSATLIDITERRRMEEAKKTLRQFFSFFSSLYAGVLVATTDGRVEFVNQAFCDLFNLDDPPESLQGLGAHEMISKIAGAYADPALTVSRIQDIVAKGSPVKGEELRMKDGRFCLVDFIPIVIDGKPFGRLWHHQDITGRKLMEDALRQTEELFSKAFSQNPDAITITRVDDGIFVSVNEGFKRSLGYTEDEVIGKTSLDLDIWDNPEHRNTVWAALNSEGKIENFEAPFRTKNGDIRYGLMSGSVIVLNGVAHILNVTKDITELRQAQEAHKLLFKAIEHASEGVIITDPTGIIQYVNPAQESLSGYTSDELLGQTANILTSDKHDDKFYSGLWDTVNSGNVWSGRFINRKKDGNEYHEDATISPVYDDSGNLTHFVAVKHDVTSQIKLQEQLLQARQMESIGMLADRFVHEFNDKLQIINGYVSLTLSRQGLPEIVRSNMRAIKQAANSGADLIKKMSVYGLKKAVKLLPLDLNERIEQARSALIQSLPSLMEIQLFLDRDLWMIKGSHSQIQQILMNLVKNAMDAMPHGGRIIIKTRNITLDENYCHYHPATKPGRYALMELSDTGKGMDNELVTYIFDPLFTTKEPGDGTGLGLAVVRGLVEQHGGRIVCLSDPSVGTTFRLYFPAMEEVPEEQYSEEKELPKGRPDTILLVDDEPSVLEIFSRLLREANYRVINASNGKDALELYEKHGGEIGLVCLDLLMPGMDGKECLRTLLGIDPKARVLVVSGALNEGMVKELKEAGASGVILKPFDMGRMLEKIRKIIDEE